MSIPVPDSFKQDITKNVLLPDYKQEITDTIQSKENWKKISDGLLVTTTFLTGLSGIFSFLNLQVQSPYMNMAAGILATLSVILKQYASFADSQQQKKVNDINTILAHVGIDFNFVDTEAPPPPPPVESPSSTFVAVTPESH